MTTEGKARVWELEGVLREWFVAAPFGDDRHVTAGQLPASLSVVAYEGRKMSNELRACWLCGSKEGVVVLKDAARHGGMVCENLVGAVECADKRDCVRRQQMKMGPPGRGWQGPRIA